MIVLYVAIVFGTVLLLLGALAVVLEARHRRRHKRRRQARPGFVRPPGFGDTPAGEARARVERAPWAS